MKSLQLSLLTAAILATTPAASASERSDTTTVFMIGDSTMADKNLKNENQERGWGQLLPIYFQGKIKIENHAVNGQSSKSFIDSKRWESVRSKISPGDFVIVQFGHNDEKANKPDRYTIPGGSFDENLIKFVDETIEVGGHPVLMSSIVRRSFSDNDTLIDTHGAYLESPRNVARLKNVTFIDMNAMTHDLVMKLGPELSKQIFMWIPAGKYEFCRNGKQDNTHLNVLGAIVVSKLAATALADNIPELRKFIRPEVYNLTSGKGVDENQSKIDF